MKVRRVCFVTGTRAEFGLMRSTLNAIRAEPALKLQLIVTGMHLDASHGRSIDAIRREGWTIDAVVPWPADRGNTSVSARNSALASAKIADALARLKSDVVLVVGDRVEAFAAASAGHLSRRIVAHVHGGDRAPGEIDDSLRHAISKLAHVHFPATAQSALRLRKLGEDRSRIHRVGSPGVDGIVKAAVSQHDLRKRFPKLTPSRYALLLQHPVDYCSTVEQKRAAQILDALRDAKIDQVVAIYPNNDPGSAGIICMLERRKRDLAYLLKDAPRGVFLALLRECAMLVGNSSSGIIEAASFGTPVISIGDRQHGRERGPNVIDVPCDRERITSAARTLWNNGLPKRFGSTNLYGRAGAGRRIAKALAGLRLDDALQRKLIAY